MTGSKKDAEHPAAVAASIFTAVVIYAVCSRRTFGSRLTSSYPGAILYAENNLQRGSLMK